MNVPQLYFTHNASYRKSHDPHGFVRFCEMKDMKILLVFYCLLGSIINTCTVEGNNSSAEWNQFEVSFNNDQVKRIHSFALIQMYDTVTFFCPYDLSQNGTYVIYRLENNGSSLVLNCSHHLRRQKQKFTVQFVPYNPLPNGFDYEYGHNYTYYAAYANGNLTFLTLKIAPRIATTTFTTDIHQDNSAARMTGVAFLIMPLLCYYSN